MLRLSGVMEENKRQQRSIQRLYIKIGGHQRETDHVERAALGHDFSSSLKPTEFEPDGERSFTRDLSKTARVKLPKLEVRKFVGKLEEWQEFWDSFESAIHLNDSLSKVDKFSYLRGLLVGPARSAIVGFKLTSANYESAVELLKNRYGKKTAIQRAHVNELLNVQPVYNERDAQRLRSLYDFLETKHRALQALEVDESTYSAIMVPSVLEKLPHALWLTITRGKEHQLWNLSDLLEALGGKIELREEYISGSQLI